MTFIALVNFDHLSHEMNGFVNLFSVNIPESSPLSCVLCLPDGHIKTQASWGCLDLS